MECKCFLAGYFVNFLCELIDTLWNVNVNSATFAPDPPCELIDTLWNVNTDDSVAIKANKTELIDTLWNVNMLSYKSV